MIVPLRRLLLPLLTPLVAVLLLCAGTRGLGQSEGGYSVRGTVLNSVTGQGVARALVILDNNRAMLTAGDGSFSFDHVAAGSTSVMIRKPGYSGFGGPGGFVNIVGGGGFAGGRSSFRSLGPPREIVVGPEMAALTFAITPQAGISGHITLSTADPADEIRVSIFRRELENGRPHWSLAAGTKTRSDGSYRFADLAPGLYRVFTSASIDGPNSSDSSEVPVFGFPALYYPGVTDVGSAGVLDLGPGEQAQADMTLVRQRFFPVTIVVRGMPQTPTGFEISDSGGHPTGLEVRFDMRTGIARAYVPNGSWTLIAHAFGRTLQFGRADFQVAGAPVSLAVDVGPMPSIPVHVRRDFTSAPDGSPAMLQGPGLNLYLASADDFAAGGGMSPMQPQEGGQAAGYEIRIFQPGRFWVETASYPPTYVASVTSGGTDLATTPLTVTPGSAPAPIEVTLRNDGGSIVGKVDSATPGTGHAGTGGESGEVLRAWIYAIPLFPTTSHLPEASLQSNGQFTFGDLAPGSYRVVACDMPQQIDFHSQEGLAAWSGKGQVVTVDPGGTANVELTVVHGDSTE